MKKLGKVLGILGGLFVFSEVFHIIGEVCAFCAMHYKYPDEVDDCLDIMSEGDDNAKKHWYCNWKLKTISKVSRFYIDNDVFDVLVK